MAGGRRTGSGAKPKPRRLKVIEGTARPDRQGGNLPDELPPGAPGEPSWARLLPGRSSLARKEAQAEWRRIVPELDRVGLLAHIDRALLVDYCVAWGRLVDCERKLSMEGLVRDIFSPDEDGTLRLVRSMRHPLSTTAKEYRSALNSYRSELGLGPASRERLNVPGAPGTSDDDEADVFGM